MTFSVNAAIRIKNSAKDLLPKLVKNYKYLLNKIDIANYHNFAMKLLHKYGYVLNKKLINISDFQILDDATVLERNLLTSTDENEFENLRDAIRYIDYNKLCANFDVYWDILSNELISRNIITYNGILIAAIKLLSIKSVANFYRSYYQMIIIDEFQDTNLLSYFLVDKLIANNRVIFLGDDIQKIYGFLGAMDDALGVVLKRYNAKAFALKNNYRFQNNDRMKQIDMLIRDYVDNYRESSITAPLLLKKMNSDNDEVRFISEGIKTILETDNNVAVLVRAGWQGKIIANKLEEEGVPFFNALYTEKDEEYINFYNVAVKEFHNNVLGKAVQRALKNCLKAVKARENEIYNNINNKYIFDSLYKLLGKLFEYSRMWDGTSKEKYINIDFSLGNKGLKHMMEYLDERVVLTTIHSAKGLEWDYVIVPQMNAACFPSWRNVCKPCHAACGCDEGLDYCINRFVPAMERKIKEELSAFYIALTRAKKDVFVTVNTGLNKFEHVKKTNCLINLHGLLHQDFEWKDYVGGDK